MTEIETNEPLAARISRRSLASPLGLRIVKLIGHNSDSARQMDDAPFVEFRSAPKTPFYD